MTKCKRLRPAWKRLRRRAVEADFEGGRLTSDAGLLLLREVDRKLGLIDAVNQAIPEILATSFISNGNCSLSGSSPSPPVTKTKTIMSHYAMNWDRGRRVIAKAERLAKRANPRFVVTTLGGDPQELYEKVYCARGDMENRIKEQQLMLFADRTSCSTMLANQFRLLLSGLAYRLLDTLRRLSLAGTKLSVAQCDTLQLKLIKVAASVRVTARRVIFHLASSSPAEPLLRRALAALSDSG